MHRVHLVIQGRVQGVGFRYFVLRRAKDLGLHGWVRNLPDGDVEAEVEGSRESLQSLIEHVRMGPPAARVDHVTEQWGEGPPRYERFTTERFG